MVISDTMKAILATDNEINNKWVVRNTENFFSKGEPEQQLESDIESGKGFAMGKSL